MQDRTCPASPRNPSDDFPTLLTKCKLGMHSFSYVKPYLANFIQLNGYWISVCYTHITEAPIAMVVAASPPDSPTTPRLMSNLKLVSNLLQSAADEGCSYTPVAGRRVSGSDSPLTVESVAATTGLARSISLHRGPGSDQDTGTDPPCQGQPV